MNELAARESLARSIINRPALTIAVVACAVSIAPLLLLFASRNAFANDFSVYWRVANEPFAAAYLPREHNPFAYPPTMLLWIRPLSIVPLWPAFAGWIAISLLAFVGACRPYLHRKTILLALVSPAAVHCIATGQVSAVMAGGLIYAFATKDRRLAGLTLAAIASVKPQLVLLAPLYLMVMHDWRAFGWAAGGFAVLVALSCAVFGPSIWVSWVNAFPDFHDVLARDRVLSVAITPAGVAENWSLPPTPFLIAGAALGVWLVSTTKAIDPIMASAIVATGSLLSAPYALVYDMLPIAPFLAREIMRGAFSASIAIGVASGPIPLLASVFCQRRSFARRPAVRDGRE